MDAEPPHILEEHHKSPPLQTDVFEVGQNRIELSWVELGSKREEGVDPQFAGIYLPGFKAAPDSKSNLDLAWALATEGRTIQLSRVIGVDTRAEAIQPKSLDLEVQAVAALLERLEIKQVLLSGHSQGGLEAIKLAALLCQNETGPKPIGLALFDPVGLYEQGKLALVANFIREYGLSLYWSKHRTRTLQSQWDVLGGIFKEIARSRSRYLKRLVSEVVEMAERYPELDKITCPVIVAQGGSDLISHPNQTVPRQARSREELQAEIQTNQDDALGALFEHSPQTKWMILGQTGHHFTPFEEDQQLAKVVIEFFQTHSEF